MAGRPRPAYLALGRNGTIYVTGEWDEAGGASKAYVAALTAAGTVSWTTPIDATAPSQDIGWAVLHSGRDVIVAGQTSGVFADNTGTDQDSWIARLNEAGVLQ